MHPILTFAAAAAKDPPLIDLDSTVFLQAGLFLITAFALTKFLFGPFLKVRAEREAGIEGARDEARRLDEEARAQMGDYEGRMSKAKFHANEERQKIRAEAAAANREIGDAARVTTQATQDQARQKLEKDAAAARVSLEARTQEIARRIATKILGREVA